MEKIVNDIVIEVPDGMEAYLEGNVVKFKPVEKKLTYDDIAKELFDNKIIHHITDGRIVESLVLPNTYYNTNNCTSNKQAEKLLAINKLMNVAKYFNDNWQPNWNDEKQNKYCLTIEMDTVVIDCRIEINNNIVYFKTTDFARKAIDILGEETIKLALCTDW